LDEFSALLHQLNIDISDGEIVKIFDEINTDRTAVDGEQVIDEQEFLEFYHNLLERQELVDLFTSRALALRGIAMTSREMLNFLQKEQGHGDTVGEEDVEQLIEEYEPSHVKRAAGQLSREGFLR